MCEMHNTDNLSQTGLNCILYSQSRSHCTSEDDEMDDVRNVRWQSHCGIQGTVHVSVGTRHA